MTTLHHTTSLAAAAEILRERALRPKTSDGFVSLSEAVVLHDISGAELTLAVDAAALAGLVEPVRYTEAWFDAHREQASYVAGDGWREQFELPTDLWDGDGEDAEPDADAEEAAWREGELDAFLAKRGEREHVSRTAGAPLPLPAEAVVGVVVHAEHLDAEEVARVLRGFGLEAEVRHARDGASCGMRL